MTQYQQITHRLRWSNGPGKGDTVSERPRDRSTREFLDGPAGTIVDIPEDAIGVDVAMLLRTGAIAPLPLSDSKRTSGGKSAAEPSDG